LGVARAKPEIKPFEPELDCASVGKRKRIIVSLLAVFTMKHGLFLGI